MARFCTKCGAKMNDNDNVCSQCGTPVSNVTVNKASTDKTGGKKGKGLKTALITIVIVAVLAVILAAVIFFSGIFGGYKSSVSKMVNSLQKNDVESLQNMSSLISEEISGDLYGKDDVYDIYEDQISNTLDKFEDSVGPIKKISYEIVDETELSKRRVQEVKDDLEDTFNIDTSSIKKIVKLDLKLTVKGSKKTEEYNVYNLFMIKEKSGWKIYYGTLNY